MANIRVFVILVIFLCLGVFFIIFYSNAAEERIVISEIGAYEGQKNEWIEIYNTGTEPIDISNWKFWENNINHGLHLVLGETGIIVPNAFAIITQNSDAFLENYPDIGVQVFDSSWQNLNEGGEEIGLIDEEGNVIETFIYIAAQDFSLQRKDMHINDYSANNWQEHHNGNSVGTQNEFIQENEEQQHDVEENPQIPEEELAQNENQEDQLLAVITTSATSTFVHTPIIFSGQFSTSTQNDIVSYIWQFGDGAIFQGVSTSYSYTATGLFVAELVITNTLGNIHIATTTIDILAKPEDVEVHQEEVNGAVSSTQYIVINEIVTDPASGNAEWIELYNTSSTAVQLTGWTLFDGVGQIAAPTSTIAANSFFVIELSSHKLNNTGDILLLKEPHVTVADVVSYGNWDDGNANDNAKKPKKTEALARSIDGQDTNNNKEDFVLSTTQTKGLSNIITAPAIVQKPSSQNNSGSGGAAPPAPQVATQRYNSGSIVINEIVSDPADEYTEFIELFNTTNRIIPLNGWSIEDGSEATTPITGTIAGKQFFVIENPKGHLNNGGDSITLYDPTGKEIDRLTYGSWDDGNTANNARIAKDPKSLARKKDGLDSDNDYYDFSPTLTITKNAANIITQSVPKNNQNITQKTTNNAPTSSAVTDIYITELFPNPIGSDSEEEFIEIYNANEEAVDITGFVLGDGSSRRYTITNGVVEPKKHKTFLRSATRIALNNTGGDSVTLYDTNNTIVETIAYTGKAPEGQSYARDTQDHWYWTSSVTSHAENTITKENTPPSIVIEADSEVHIGKLVLFDASDSADSDGDTLSFVWEFENGRKVYGEIVTHSFGKVGQETVTLLVNDGNITTTEKMIILVDNTPKKIITDQTVDAAEALIISEIFPNPKGADTTEFVEIYNPSATTISLAGIKVDDEVGGSKGYAFSATDTIAAQSYKVIKKEESRIAFNNGSDSARLLFADGSIISEVRYDDVVEDASFVYNQAKNVWQWTQTKTPGEKNSITEISEKQNKTNRNTNKTKRKKPIIPTRLEEIAQTDIGDRVKIHGVVAVLPGVLGSQYFYIVGSPGVQIYMHKKDFPNISLGDEVEVIGEVSEAYGQTRVKVAQKEDIQIINHPGIPQAAVVDIAQVYDNYDGWLVQISGEITEAKSSHLYVDDGTEEVKVYIKRGTGIKKHLFQVGDLVNVTGIVVKTKNGYQLLPRSQKDIQKTGRVQEHVVVPDSITAPKKGIKDVEKYLTATIGGLSVLLFGLVLKVYGNNILCGIKKVYAYVYTKFWQ